MRRRLLPVVLTLIAASPALAVGLAPLAKEGITAGPAKAFYLTVINPYPEARTYRAYVEGGDPAHDEVAIVPASLTIKPGGQRRVTVVIRGLEPGETRETRICAELARQEGMIHARVCSQLVARRLAGRS